MAPNLSRLSQTFRVGFLGLPRWDGQLIQPVAWDAPNLARLKQLGFNTLQIHVAWATRPPGEPLNLEDVVALPDELNAEYPQPLSIPGSSPESREAIRRELIRRIGLCKDAGMRTIFHFGAPFNHPHQEDAPPNCISNEKVLARYALLLEALARQVPGIDDILIYTYDQYAWLCSEFGDCPRCAGVPLHERLPAFIDRLAATWSSISPAGRVWWEPWELSAGQVYRCLEQLRTPNLGLALHANIAEVQTTLPVDRWFKNTCRLAAQRGIPVLAEYFLGGFSEELEPLGYLAFPLVTLRGLKAIAAVPGVCGIKEYFGLAPHKEDPNLRMTGLFFENPDIAEAEALARLAEPYGPAAPAVIEFWEQVGRGMELFPWDATWCIRRIGASSPAHSLSAAVIRGYQWQTPSWRANREAAFLSNTLADPHPWMVEDVQIRCEMAAEDWAAAHLMGSCFIQDIPAEYRETFRMGLEDLARLKRRTLAYAYHFRETNLANILRGQRSAGRTVSERNLRELKTTLAADLRNVQEEMTALAAAPFPCGSPVPVDDREFILALDRLERDPNGFLDVYFLPEEDHASRGFFSATSR